MSYSVYDNGPPTLAQRIAARTDFDGPVPEHAPHLGNCHVWIGATSGAGYGQIREQRRIIATHRWTMEQAYGPIPRTVEVCHRCDNPPCRRLSHLFLHTHRGNMLDASSKGRADGNGERIGSANGQARITEADVVAIRASSDSNAALGERYSLLPSSVWRIRTGKAWKHVPMP